ncbi:MAG: TetR/AcrR family transcriptional regulator [Solirubrobacterales bacterium]|nr:TetR/AcrR family transcriptional regulator [Solirubrobacterales bacterium]
MATDTRTRILDASAALLARQGYNATGVKQIVTEAKAPFGSVYHHFPGGKQEIGAAAVVISGKLYEQLIPAVFDNTPDLPTGVRWFFNGAAQHLVETDFADACPIATVALETASTSEQMREACAAVFNSWIAAGSEMQQTRGGLSPESARRLTIAMIAALEGAFVLARAQRSVEPLEVAGELVAEAAEREQSLGQRAVSRAPASDETSG